MDFNFLLDAAAVYQRAIAAAKILDGDTGITAKDETMLAADGIGARTEIAFATSPNQELVILNRDGATRLGTFQDFEINIHGDGLPFILVLRHGSALQDAWHHGVEVRIPR